MQKGSIMYSKFILYIFVLIFIVSSCKKNNINSPDTDEINSVDYCDLIWTKKNLDVDHYLNGDAIPEVRDPEEWKNLKTGAWCYYNNDPSLGAIYGKLYNSYAINDPRGLAPKGWHVVREMEWKLLENCLGIEQTSLNKLGLRGLDEGGKLKEAGSDHWMNPNTGASNTTKLTALPAGRRDENGNFLELNKCLYWWSYPDGNTTGEIARILYYDIAQIGRDHFDKRSGFSVRCVKDY